jgi:DNA-binding SARP family transcriptional activator/energy-coupling factor transporter ATP-binding protein EcfA2
VNAVGLDGLGVAGASRIRIGSSVAVVSTDGSGYELRGSAAVVLAWVVLEGRADRRRMSALLWPESDPAQARSNLRVLTHRINQRFGSELLVGTVHLEFDGSLAQFELQDADAVLAALAAGGAARCELLADAGVEAHAGEDLLAWLASARKRLKEVQLAQLGEALTEAFALARHARAAALARACVQLDPLSEHRHRRLMEVLARAGDRAAALSAYEDCKALFKQHLGVLPGEQTRMVQLRILQQQALGAAPGGQPFPGPDSEALTASSAAASHPLVEREAVLAQARAALEQGVHVVVLGEPGVGKTRLLRRLAAMTEGQTEHVALHAALEQEPYAALAQLLQAVQPRRRPCVGMAEQVELARLAPLAFAEVKPSETALSAPRLHAALRHWFARLGEAGVRVLVLDDVQYADAASQAAFSSLLESAAVAGERAPALLMAHRSAEVQAVLDDAVTQAQTQHRALRVELPRLSLSGVQALLASMGAAPRTDQAGALAQHLHKRTGGNPLFVIELARQALEQGEASGTADLQALLVARLQRCSATAQQVAAVAAVAPEHFTVELAAVVSEHTALALMPAWRELEQRGLFARQGLAHDLIQDAVLAALPRPILRVLHGQVAQYLEGQGMRGTSVLRHWWAAGDADRALPHAVHQLYNVSAAGLPTAQQELAMLDLLERASDEVLLAHLWCTAEVGESLSEFALDAIWRRVVALRERVDRLPGRSGAAAWIAFETARCCNFIDLSPKAAYELLEPVAARMPERGAERAFVEHKLAALAVGLTGMPHAHLRRAREALAGLPDVPSVNRVRRHNDHQSGIYVNPVEGIKTQAARWRNARQRQDMATVADASALIGRLQAFLGNVTRSMNHYARAARLTSAGGTDTRPFPDPLLVGKIALSAGHYALSHQLLTSVDGQTARLQRLIYLALLHLRMGNLRQAQEQLDQVNPEALREHFASQVVHGHARAELDRLEGNDPLPRLQQQLESAQAFGVSGVNLELLAWEITLHTQPLAERLAGANALLAQLRRHNVGGYKLAKPLLEIAEVCAEAEAPQWACAAAESARLLRRGCTNATLYLPEGLVRCARLIRRRDAHEANALVQVAQRWVRHALHRLPPGAEEGFRRHVVVNRLLLDGDDQAVYLQPLG